MPESTIADFEKRESDAIYPKRAKSNSERQDQEFRMLKGIK